MKTFSSARVRRLGFLAALSSCLLLALAAPRPITHASGPNYYYQVIIRSDADAESSCWGKYGFGSGCSTESCNAARVLAISAAGADLGPCPGFITVIDEYCIEDSECTP
ncbi:MAG TPA: hypothetical protein VGO68_05150 [Pyrinomonadaceae bacterium]|jgi:hypothetical protein|nr:hypothetical protein [Pyrinomonadaceae bacterium]